MVEGQEGVGWERWRRLARAVDALGYAGLYRSDHFPNDQTGAYRDSLELWASLTWLAENTSRIEFGPLVSPVSFRHPVITAWQASTVDNLAEGRLRLGLGAGWHEWSTGPSASTCSTQTVASPASRRGSRSWPGCSITMNPCLSTASSTEFKTPCSCHALRGQEERPW